MRLHINKIGAGCPLIILHGLYGSGDNWYRIGRQLSRYFTIYLVDQRNHGNSPHDPVFNYDVLTADLVELYRSENIEQACIIGHSMGGKVAMHFTLQFPSRVMKLVVIDIALRSYEASPQMLIHQYIVKSLIALDILHLTTRSEVDDQLARTIPQASLRQFLLKNLKRKDNNSFFWGLNLIALQDNLTELLRRIDYDEKSFQGPVLVVSGKNSGYLNADDRHAFAAAFPCMRYEEIDAGHWVHVEQPEQLIDLLLDFLPFN
jgi:esterase